MSVEPSEATNEVWTRWQGHVINNTFPLGRCLGSSDHSGVFLTRADAFGSSELAIKLVPTNRAMAEVLLPRWKRAGGLAHPHLLTLLQWGGCQLEGLPYLYALMEYADQTLAQLLLHRALIEAEAGEMLPPIADALSYLHGQDLVQGQLKPSNILVVGDQLKLASDTIRRRGEGAISVHPPTVYDPPEGRQGSTSPAADVWALGVTLCQALVRRVPLGLSESNEGVVLPADLPPSLRDVVARCLSRDPASRPGASEVVDLARGSPGETTPIVTAEAVALTPPVPATPEPKPPELNSLELKPPEPAESQAQAAASSAPSADTPDVTGEFEFAAAPAASTPAQAAWDAQQPTASAAESAKPRVPVSAIVGALVVVAVGWAAIRGFSGHRAVSPSPPPVQAPAAAATVPAVAAVSAGPAAGANRAVTPPPDALHEVVPEVPSAARRTIRGHIKIWVRVIVNPDGSVFAAVPDRPGPSRYFQRLALDAAKKWMFPPADGSAQRLMQVRFDFSREGVTGRAVPIH